MSLTPTQREAVSARGNVLVVAGAGTGKTHTLVERCLDCLIEARPRVTLDQILILAFNEAAAAEMRQRIRQRLEEESNRRADAFWWREQLALFETAHIGTLHSFCLQLVRQHFYELGLDPQLSVLADEEACLMAEETLEGLFQKYYAGRTPGAEAVQQLIQTQSRGWDRPIRSLVLRIHHYSQTLPDPTGWLENQLGTFSAPEPADWWRWLLEGIEEWSRRWLPALQSQAAINPLAGRCADALKPLMQLLDVEFIPGRIRPPVSRKAVTQALENICAESENYPDGKKTAWFGPLAEFAQGAAFLGSLAQMTGVTDPLVEDWNWVRTQMTTLLQLVKEFSKDFTEAKRESGMADFHDLEQYALRLLWDVKSDQRNEIAKEWRERLHFVFVDEYQDINAAQDKIIEALSREGAQANRFLVGDVKQSIYRFRLADPSIFQRYAASWRNGDGKSIALSENFRSRESILKFVNSLCGAVMRPELGGVRYDEQAALRVASTGNPQCVRVAAKAAASVELHLLRKKRARDEDAEEPLPEELRFLRDLEENSREARLAALRLAELKAANHQVWDKEAARFRPAEWSDMVILLRSPANRSDAYAKEFARLNIPLQVARGGFYESREISDLVSLLQLLDNPLQDLPALAVLHSPIVGLNINELATIRLAAKGSFWTALTRWHEGQRSEAGTGRASRTPESGTRSPKPEEADGAEIVRKVSLFLERFGRWRRLARQSSLSHCLETVLNETLYADWLLAQSHGQQRYANVQRLLGLAQQFDQFQRQGLFRFLRFIEAQKRNDSEPKAAPVAEDNAVRLMSIHQSKGLEFPVVLLANLAKPFNLSDLHADVILDEKYGLCPQIKPPHTGNRYHSLTYWLAGQRQKRETLGEELRLLYVAMTRARDTLILMAAVSQKRLDVFGGPKCEITTAALLSARSYADWLALWFSQNRDSIEDARDTADSSGDNGFLRWTIHDHSDLAASDPTISPTAQPDTIEFRDPKMCEDLQQRLSWEYPFLGASREPAKTSVSTLRRQAAEEDDFIQPLQSPARPRANTRYCQARGGTAVQVGSAHHAFLQFVALDRVCSVQDLEHERQRLLQQKLLTTEQGEVLDLEALAAFWNSELGGRVLANSKYIRRELAFTARFPANELAEITHRHREANLENEFVVVQGVADLALVMPREVWIIDFKTDAITREETRAQLEIYAPQLKLYGRALSQIYRRPVSACWLYFLACRMAVPLETNGFQP